MARTKTEKGLIDPNENPLGEFSVYANDDGEGTVQTVSKHDGVTRTVDFTAEEWERIAVGGIKMGMIAQAAAKQKRIQLPSVRLTPEMSALIAKANGGS